MNFFDELPEGYIQKFEIDAGEKKWGIILNVVALIPLIVILILGWYLKGFTLDSITDNPAKMLISSLVTIVVLIVYIVLHELVHGLFYKIFTKKKLTFGLKLTCAYCGVPSIYSKKWPMFVTTLAPLVVFSIPSIILMILLPADIICAWVFLFFAIHVSGCVGDIFVAALLLVYPKDALIRDTGPKQTFYIKK